MKTNWQTKKLGEVCDIFNGNSINAKIKKEKYFGLTTGFPFIATKDVSFDSSIDYENGVKIPNNETGFKISKKDSVLICAEGGSAGRKIGFTEQNVCFGNKLFSINSEEQNNKFIYYFCFTNYFQKEFKKSLTGIIGGVSLKKFKEIQIPLSPLSEQHRIVKILDEVFEKTAKAKENAERNLQNAKELFESYLQRVFSSEKLKVESEKWEEKTLKEMSIEFGRGKSKCRPRNDKKLYGGKYPFIQTGDIRNCNHFITKYSQTYNDIGLAQSRLWPKGTICITIAANIAETGILNFDACFPDSVVGIVVNPKIAELNFVEYLLQSFKVRLQAKGKGSAQKNINLATFEYELFPFPPLPEQKSIVKKLDVLSAETKKLEAIYIQKLSDLEELKKSVLKKSFEGKL